jgi:hypothetical protein
MDPSSCDNSQGEAFVNALKGCSNLSPACADAIENASTDSCPCPSL